MSYEDKVIEDWSKRFVIGDSMIGDSIKSFISKALQQQRTELIKEVMECLPHAKPDNHEELFSHRAGHCKCTFNSCRYQFLDNLKEKNLLN